MVITFQIFVSRSTSCFPDMSMASTLRTGNGRKFSLSDHAESLGTESKEQKSFEPQKPLEKKNTNEAKA